VSVTHRLSAFHRKTRERRPLAGMLLFQDGSTHRRICGLDYDFDLVVTLDDATGVIYSALLVAQEGTMSRFLGLAEKIAAKGLFRALYTPTAGRTTSTRPKPAASSTLCSRIPCTFMPGVRSLPSRSLRPRSGSIGSGP
jgi:hypothetical protein